MPKRDIAWWWWLVIDLLVATSLLVDRRMLAAVFAVAAAQVVLFATSSGWTSFPAQVRIAYLGLLLIGLWHPAGFIHWIQLGGTTAMVLFGYCLLARCLSLLPFNRIEPLSAALVMRTFFAPPVASVIASRQRHAR
jgi:hypothetical protein